MRLGQFIVSRCKLMRKHHRCSLMSRRLWGAIRRSIDVPSPPPALRRTCPFSDRACPQMPRLRHGTPDHVTRYPISHQEVPPEFRWANSRSVQPNTQLKAGHEIGNGRPQTDLRPAIARPLYSRLDARHTVIASAPAAGRPGPLWWGRPSPRYRSYPRSAGCAVLETPSAVR